MRLPAAEQSLLLFNRGLILDTLGRPDEAVADYSAAIKLTPGFAPAFNNRANVYRRQNRVADARRDYLASLAAGNPLPEYSWYGLGQMDEAETDNRAARDDYAHAVAANPAYQLAADRLFRPWRRPDPAAGPATGDEIIHLHPPGEAAGADAAHRPSPPPARDDGSADPAPPKSRPAVPELRPARYAPEQGPGSAPGAWTIPSPPDRRSSWEPGAAKKTRAQAGTRPKRWPAICWEVCRPISSQPSFPARAAITASAPARSRARRRACARRWRRGAVTAFPPAIEPPPRWHMASISVLLAPGIATGLVEA